LTGTSAAHAVRWAAGSAGATDLGFSTDTSRESLLVAASENGAVAGYRDDGTRFVPFWAASGGAAQDIQTAAGVAAPDRRAGRAADVNNDGVVVGCWLLGS